MSRPALAAIVCAAALAGVAVYWGIGRRGLRPGDAARGREVFDARCWVCHETDTADYRVGPGLQSYFQRNPHQLKDGSQHRHTDEFVREFIRSGSMNMPPQRDVLSEQELADVIAYLKTL